MVIRPKPSSHAHPLKTYSKEFNLLRPGSGIRFLPSEKGARAGKESITAPLRLLLLMLLLGGAAALYLNIPAQPPARRKAVVRISPPPRIMQEESVTADAVPVIGKAEQARPATPQYRIRFGLFLSRENADRHAQSLAKKGVTAVAETAKHPMTSFTLKAGPAYDAAWKDLKTAAAKLNVAPIVEVDGKYLLVGPIWLKDRALMAENTLKASGVPSEIVEERTEREVFKVLSAPFETVEGAKRAIGEMQTNGIEGVIDE